MKSIFFIAAFTALLTGVCTVSCNKDQPPEPEQMDSVVSLLPKQVIIDYPSQFGALEDEVISFKYDTANYKIALYRDDTTNTNPYDELLASYSFNKDGYLIHCTGVGLYQFSDDEDVTISRASDNKITSIVYHYGNEGNEPFAFKYESLFGGTRITTASLLDPDLPDTAIYEYDEDGRILSIPVFRGTQNIYYPPAMDDEFDYTYNADKSLHEVSRKSFGEESIKMVMDYSSGLPVGDKDWLSELLLGKDYYLLNLSVFNPFSFSLEGEVDPYLISATNPYHISQIEETSQSEQDVINATMTYQLANNKLLSSVVLNSVNSQYGTFTTGMYFKY